MDARLARARELHQEAQHYQTSAQRSREQRDALIMQLARDGESFARIARGIGCSPELVSKIVRVRRHDGQH
jgi:transposase-like protein